MPELKPRRKSQMRVIFPGSPDLMARRSIQTQFIHSMHLHLEQIALSDELIITDPFLLNPREKAWNKWYASFLEALFDPIYTKVQRITFVMPMDKCNPVCFSELEKQAVLKACQIRLCHSEVFHDRYWLSVTNRKGLTLGNSLTGIGSKVSTLSMLSDDDALQVASIIEPLLATYK